MRDERWKNNERDTINGHIASHLRNKRRFIHVVLKDLLTVRSIYLKDDGGSNETKPD